MVFPPDFLGRIKAKRPRLREGVSEREPPCGQLTAGSGDGDLR
jgi:hypothetical protein